MIRIILTVVAFALTNTSVHADSAVTYLYAAAHKYGVAPAFAMRVAKVESGYNCSVVGSHGEVGPLQILPATARALGYSNIRHASCHTKTEAGMKHLAMCYRGARGNWSRAAACHNAGLASLKWRRYPSFTRNYVRMVMR